MHLMHRTGLVICLLLSTFFLLNCGCADELLSWSASSYPVYEQGGSYPRMIQLQDGTLLCGFDAAMGGSYTCIVVCRSSDGEHWTAPVVAAALPGFDCANANLIQLENGDILLAYRAVRSRGKQEARILCAISRDNGFTWSAHSTVTAVSGPGGLWEPHLIMVDGKVALFYSNDSDAAMGGTGFQNIEFKLLEADGWGERRIAANGNLNRSRDGMPVVDRLSDGRYVLVVEGNALPDYVMVIRMKFSPDGLDWSEPLRTICAPAQAGAGKKAAAPYVTVLPGDVLAVSYQTDEDATASGDHVSVMKVVLSRDFGVTWSEPFEPFRIPDGSCAVWNSLYWTGQRLYALTSSNFPEVGIYLRAADYCWPE